LRGQADAYGETVPLTTLSSVRIWARTTPPSARDTHHHKVVAQRGGDSVTEREPRRYGRQYRQYRLGPRRAL